MLLAAGCQDRRATRPAVIWEPKTEEQKGKPKDDIARINAKA